MSEGGGGGHPNLGWETQSWAFSNSDNSGGSESKSGKQPPTESHSNSPAATEPTASGGQKRSRNGASKNGKRDWNESKGGESDHEIHIWTERERRKKMRNMFSNLHALLPQLPAKVLLNKKDSWVLLPPPAFRPAFSLGGCPHRKHRMEISTLEIHRTLEAYLADKSTIVDEAVSYIKTLQQSIQKLQKQRLEAVRSSATESAEKLMVAPPRTPAVLDQSREAFIADRTSSSSKSWPGIINSSPLVSFPCFSQTTFQTWSSPNVVLSVCGNDAQISVCTARKPGILTTIFYILEKHKLEVVTANISSDYFRSMSMIHAHVSSTDLAHTYLPWKLYPSIYFLDQRELFLIRVFLDE
ncbi:hypothetical protein ACLOJK_031189 [Asimina triloba]